MKKKMIVFCGKLALVLCLVLVFLLGVISPQYTQGFNGSILDKVARLEAIEEPKIVLIGNSNLPFGIRSELIEEAFDMPVVNMGVHGGLGNVFHENMAKLNVRAGDIYVVSHTEYNGDGDYLDPSVAWITIENHFPLWRLIPRGELGGMKDAVSTYVKKAFLLWADGSGNEATEDAYSRLMFNEYGDDIYPRPQSEEGIPFEEQTIPPIEEATIQRLNELNAYLKERGATMLVAAYPIASGEFTPLVSDYDAFGEALAEALDAPVISYFPEYMFDYSYFYDTLYHLTDEGTEMRTRILIEDISLWRERAENEA